MSKVITMEQAFDLVTPGSTLGLGGMTLYRRPVAFVQALLAGDVSDLTLISLTCGLPTEVTGSEKLRAKSGSFSPEPVKVRTMTEGFLK